jgi:outer membrane lipoprotein-sorting protein
MMNRAKLLLRCAALALVASPLAMPVGAPAYAEPTQALAQVSTHLKSVSTMTADFEQANGKGGIVPGTLTLKRPGKIRFQYRKGYPLLVVGDGKALTMIDYEVKQVSRWPIGNSPLAVLLNPDVDLSRIASVVQDNPQQLMIRAHDAKHPEFGTITITFGKVPSAPGGLMLQGWTIVDAQSGRTSVRLTNQKFNVAVADSTFRWTDPRGSGPRG